MGQSLDKGKFLGGKKPLPGKVGLFMVFCWKNWSGWKSPQRAEVTRTLHRPSICWQVCPREWHSIVFHGNLTWCQYIAKFLDMSPYLCLTFMCLCSWASVCYRLWVHRQQLLKKRSPPIGHRISELWTSLQVCLRITRVLWEDKSGGRKLGGEATGAQWGKPGLGADLVSHPSCCSCWESQCLLSTSGDAPGLCKTCL